LRAEPEWPYLYSVRLLSSRCEAHSGDV
jgi:hypothetical protein